MTWNIETQTWNIDVSGAVNILNTMAETNLANAIYTLHNLEEIIQKHDTMTDSIYTAFRNQVTDTQDLNIYFTNFGKLENKISNGSDTIYGTDENNYINGLAGNDKIYGQGGNDTLVGGAGDDYLVGGNGSDTYFFEGNWGNDSIDNSNTNEKGTHPDTIEFGQGILPSDVTVLRQGNDLILSLNDGADTVKVYSYFLDAGNTTNTVDNIKFADGTIWTYDTVRVKWNSAPVEVGGTTTREGGSGNDVLRGGTNTDFLIGNDGNDYLNGDNGNDILYGGKGNDSLYGGTGNDLYIWNLGDGLDYIYDNDNYDTISFGPGINFADLTFRNVNNDLQIMIKNDPSQGFTLSSFFYSLSYKIEDLSFADGTVVHLSEIGLVLQQQDEDRNIKATEFADTIYCGNNGSTVLTYAGNDIIYGGNGTDRIIAGDGNDTLIGGLGNDNLYGDDGDDTYVYNLGDGFDTISESGGNDQIVFGDGITQSNLSFEKFGNNLKISINGDEVKGIQINSQFNSSAGNKVETIEFHDGSTLDISNADQLIQAMSTFGVAQGAADNTLSNPTQNVSEMYNLTVNNGITQKAI